MDGKFKLKTKAINVCLKQNKNIPEMGCFFIFVPLFPETCHCERLRLATASLFVSGYAWQSSQFMCRACTTTLLFIISRCFASHIINWIPTNEQQRTASLSLIVHSRNDKSLGLLYPWLLWNKILD